MKLLASLLLLLASGVTARTNWQSFHYDEKYFVMNSCNYAVANSVKLCKKPDAKKSHSCSCVEPNFVASWLKCAYEKMDAEDVEYMYHSTCDSTKGHLPWKAAQEYYENSTYVNLADQYVNSTKLFKHPIYSTGEHFQNLYTAEYWTIKNRFGNLTTSNYMGLAFFCATILVMLVSGAVNWSQRLVRRIQLTGGDNFFVNLLRKHFTVGILGKHLTPGRFGYTPDRMETFWITIMVLYTILGNAIIGVHWRSDDVSFLKYQAGTSRYFGDRSGLMLSWYWPLLFIFPGRNNFFQWVTRWKYGRFLTFHKWIARCVFIMVLIHSFAFASQTYSIDHSKLVSRMHAPWYLYGIVSTVFGGAIIIFAVYPFRSRFYDIFKVIHVVFAVMMLWSGLIHARSQNYENYYYAGVAIWCFEYVARFVRVALYGIGKTARITYCADDQVLKVVVPESKLVKPSAGSHAFIYFLTKSNFYKSHCFTAVPSVEPGFVEFYCKVKKGLTLNLAKRISEGQELQVRVMVEGFYGESSPYHYFDKTVLITGSTGISGPFAHAMKLVKSDGQREVKLYWSVRTLAALEWFKEQLLQFKDTQVRPIIYVSQPFGEPYTSTNSESNDSSAEEKSGNPIEKVITSEKEIAAQVGEEIMQIVQIRHGRIDVAQVVAEEIDSANGTIAFGACSATQIVDTVRQEVANNLGRTEKRIEYFEEMQAW